MQLWPFFLPVHKLFWMYARLACWVVHDQNSLAYLVTISFRQVKADAQQFAPNTVVKHYCVWYVLTCISLSVLPANVFRPICNLEFSSFDGLLSVYNFVRNQQLYISQILETSCTGNVLAYHSFYYLFGLRSSQF